MFWANFTRICQEQDTTVSGACKKAGLDKNRPYNWRTKEGAITGTLPKETELIALAGALGCSVADFFLEEGATVTKRSQQLTPQEWSLLEAFSELNEVDKARILVNVHDLRKLREQEDRERLG